ncbi:50S ribosomal protein L15 [Schleiferia thermophila]|jgi:large subunit ribosomal protein L15|uniref:Large ribosomal subunit protein uL15 n=1 Tax=Schleiferia thermophila TaxID=884107 RepID=A0A369A8U5_9FLAO|nr:50S ribosomal protein L15 [Schleiferia thermophila]KFD38348.1 50S ribosomal protein L15 [Schleiferia thermophila str. Yellowstone]RCX04838.1 LSU ribosomal protein L15P [Schleiferia thermophila]GCD79635.1 50S ribosomal protein L15 [Schleiferia thermophila]
MKLQDLKPVEGSTHKEKRIGRGEGSGHGGTSTRGHKGDKQHSGYRIKRGFEGGQMPLQRRIPKFGFKNFNRVEYRAINLDVIQSLIDQQKVEGRIAPDDLVKLGLAGKNDLIKILGRGELKTKIEVVAHKFSNSAIEAIKNAGGEVVTI